MNLGDDIKDALETVDAAATGVDEATRRQLLDQMENEIVLEWGKQKRFKTLREMQLHNLDTVVKYAELLAKQKGKAATQAPTADADNEGRPTQGAIE